jgi:hypothetical protein
MREKNKQKRPWGLTDKQFAAKMRRLPRRLQAWEVESDRLVREIRNTKVSIKRLREAHMMLTSAQRNFAKAQFRLTYEALDAHVESLELQLASCQRTKRKR